MCFTCRSFWVRFRNWSYRPFRSFSQERTNIYQHIQSCLRSRSFSSLDLILTSIKVIEFIGFLFRFFGRLGLLRNEGQLNLLARTVDSDQWTLLVRDEVFLVYWGWYIQTRSIDLMHFCAPPKSVKKYQMRKFLQNHFNNLNCFFFLLIQKGIIKSCATLRIAVTNLEILKLKEVFNIRSDRFLACDHQNRFS